MTSQLVFVAMSVEDAVLLRDGVDLGHQTGCGPTASLAAAVGVDAVQEEVEYAALSYAAELAPAAVFPRLVLAADVESDQLVDQRSGTGEVIVTGLRWPQVQSLFADDPSGSTAHPDADLLWFAVTELDVLSTTG